ncbi:tetratricopeptide repeat protein [Paludisphaera mucosa]|uniref:Tetratricopeptide repeat protein n=1 Tax=Paludisphaera mucosa TaxID=3030827 RepID=A0ABT6FHB5_9BACT|nr:tetratricopeptide repeat protein [Paludisphaera mucosa]MDG3006954.1 tetratricopeptide repeat protein [Paludisphaera mucosa]
MQTMTWIQSRWNRLRAAHRADLPALAVARGRELVDRHPECGPAWKILGSALVDLARYDEADEAIRRATSLCPPGKLWVTLAEMGHLHRARGNLSVAAAWYRRAINAAPEEAGAHIFLGGILAQSGRLKEAEAAHRTATLCEYGCRDEAFLNLGLVLRAQDRLDEAAGCFEAALELDPKYKPAKLALRDVHQAIRVQKAHHRDASARRDGDFRDRKAAVA